MEAGVAKILVIDDEVGMREGCRRALTSQGFQVCTAEHGVEGVQKLRDGDFDLVLLDAMMPGMGGIEILDRIRQYGLDVASVMITGYATVELATDAMKLGAHDFLPKPFTSDELLAVVSRALQERRRRAAIQQQREEEEDLLLLERTHREQANLDAIESRFMLVVVHELRNPAGVIKNYLQLMRGGYVEADEYDEYLANLDLRAGQLLSMLDDLLELANLKARHGLTKTQPVDLAALLEQVAKDLGTEAEGKGLDFQVEILARPTMQARPGHIESLWANLIDNAIKYTPDGRVTASLVEEDGQILVVVADTGIGISTEELTRIFQDFYRSASARELVELGTGLGLPIVNQIVQIYQGTIQVDSVPGQGSRFTVNLPLAPARRRA
jgi:signal transduction histidine kinase